MSTDSSSNLTPAELLHQYLGERIFKEGRDVSVASLLAEFDQYCRERDMLRRMLQEANAASERGESTPLDVEDLIQRGRERLARGGNSG